MMLPKIKTSENYRLEEENEKKSNTDYRNIGHFGANV